MNASPVLFCAGLLSVLASLPAQSNDGQAERVVQILPVGYLLASYDDPRPPLLGSFLRDTVRGNPQDPLLEQHANEAMLSISSLAELVMLVGGEEFSDGRASIETTETSLLFTGSSEAVRRARQMTEEIGRIVVRPIRV